MEVSGCSDNGLIDGSLGEGDVDRQVLGLVVVAASDLLLEVANLVLHRAWNSVQAIDFPNTMINTPEPQP
jgi:hypothetical protein